MAVVYVLAGGLAAVSLCVLCWYLYYKLLKPCFHGRPEGVTGPAFRLTSEDTGSASPPPVVFSAVCVHEEAGPQRSVSREATQVDTSLEMGDKATGPSPGTAGAVAGVSIAAAAAHPDHQGEGAACGEGAAQGSVTEGSMAVHKDTRRKVLLAVLSSISDTECARAIRRMSLPPGTENVVCGVVWECCLQEHAYRPFYALLAQQLCDASARYGEQWGVLFGRQYAALEHLEPTQLAQGAKFFAHLLSVDAVPWTVFQHVQLSEETAKPRRTFLKTLLVDLSDRLGVVALRARLDHPRMTDKVRGLFPRGNPTRMQVANSFFSSIGLEPLVYVASFSLRVGAVGAVRA